MMKNSKKEQVIGDLIQKALNNDATKQIECSIDLLIENEVWHAYNVSISFRSLMFYTNKGTAYYLVDSYGDRQVMELLDWERE